METLHRGGQESLSVGAVASEADGRRAVIPAGEALVAARPAVVSVLRGYGIAAQDVDDVAQAVLLTAWDAIRWCRYRPDPDETPARALTAWLRGIAWRVAAHHVDRCARSREDLVEEPLGQDVASDGDPLAAVLGCEAQMRVRLAIESMPEHLRVAMTTLVEDGEISASEYGRRVGVPTSTAYRWIQQAKARLGVVLAEEGIVVRPPRVARGYCRAG